MSANSFGAEGTLSVEGKKYEIFRINTVGNHEKLPYSLKILLENLLRSEDGSNVTAEHIRALSSWNPEAQPDTEIQFTPGRVIMQDFTGVPCVVDLATMREAVVSLGGDPNKINPISPAELVIDHSVQIDVFGEPDAFKRNMEMEYQRNAERYRFLRWGQTAFDDFRVVPPGTGIVHQVNIEYLAHAVMTRPFVKPDGSAVLRAYPDSCVGTDSHTTMVNGLGVLGWGVGGIEAEAAMLGQPISMLIPRVVGFKLIGSIGVGVTATDVVLTITQMLRRHGVVGKFVEFYGEGVAQVPLANRATIGNMSPEFGSTIAIFPVDQATLDYLRLTGRGKEQLALVEAYSKEQGLWHDPDCEVRYSEYIELDLSSVVPSIAGPKRPQDRINVKDAKGQFCRDLENYAKVRHSVEVTALMEAQQESFPASDPPAVSAHKADDIIGHSQNAVAEKLWERISSPTRVTMADGRTFTLDHGAVAIASITSCTNTSNPSVMMAAALLARNAVAKGLKPKPWVKTSLAPGSKVVTDYYNKSGLTRYLEDLGFYLVGYGCTTCIGNSGPIAQEISSAINSNSLSVVSVLSGNRNFEGRINPDVKMNYLASPPLVIAYALAGSMNFDFETDELGKDGSGNPVFLRDIWPSPAEIDDVVMQNINQEMFASDYANVFEGDETWRSLPAPEGETFQWDPKSTYVRRPPYFEGMERVPKPVADIGDARVLAFLGDSVTTDHISPAGSFTSDTPAGRYLIGQGVERKDFNSYGSRRGNHEVMIRGTFANIRLKNKLLHDVEGGFTRDFTCSDGPQATIYEAAQHYREAQTPLIILAGKEYGSGSSRDWAAKGTSLLGVQAVIAESFERIHRSNLIGMGVIPLQFPSEQTALSLGLTGEEIFSIKGITAFNDGLTPETVLVSAQNPKTQASVVFDAVVRVDTPSEADYYRNGGILHYVLRSIMQRAS